MKSCYTCRRRRLKCDGIAPRCHKCIANKVVCLGYQKPITWIGGAAIKGHLQSWTNSTYSVGFGSDTVAAEVGIASPTNLERRSVGKKISPKWSLTEPGLQHLSHDERYLIDYYEHKLCPSLIFNDTPNNPFRRLVSMVDAHSALSSAAMALAACHKLHTLTNIPLLLQQTGTGTNRSTAAATVTSATVIDQADQKQQALEQVLTLKHRSIRYLSSAMGETENHHKPVTIATILLLVILEMWETGWGAWNLHVEGAKKLLAYLYNTGVDSSSSPLTGMIASISVYETFGATVLRPGKLTKSLRSRLNTSNDSLDISITGCPSEIFDAINSVNSQHQIGSASQLSVNDISTSGPLSVARLYATLARLENFDAEKFAKETYSYSAPQRLSLNGFTHFCLAWRVAAELYTKRVIYTLTDTSAPSFEAIVKHLIEHCKIVLQEYDGIKCFVWPVFIAGVESDSQVDRDWVLSALDQFWRLYLGANIKAVASILKILWANNDLRRKGNDDFNWNWIKELHLLNVDSVLGLR